MQVYFRPGQLDEICNHENYILERCKETIHSFEQNTYRGRGITFRVLLARKDDISGRIYDIQRPVIQNGYMSFVRWQVLTTEGKIVESEDHDMYMDFAIQIGWCSNGVVCLDDSIDELYEYNAMVEDYFADPY